MIKLLYPEYREVLENQIMTWANDCFLNGDCQNSPINLAEAIEILEDLGLITVDRGES